MPDETVDAESYRKSQRTPRALSLILYREAGAEIVDLQDGAYVVGRDPELLLSVDDKRVSRRHATIEVKGPAVVVTDQGSRNGTVVAGRAAEAKRAYPLRVGDSVVLGGGPVLLLIEAETKETGGLFPENLDPNMKEVLATAKRVATTPLAVLLLGETGVGKEIIARTIHTWSPRREKPFFALNCAALPENLLEAELFGHEKGAFTGATDARRGMVEAADTGTLFLDEIGDLQPRLQAKLLRFLDDRSFQRVGGNDRKTVDVRLLAATNRDLAEQVKKGGFREDLLFRLNSVTIKVPPLRERPAEMEALCSHFAAELAKRLGRKAPSFSSETMSLLRRYDWPGNVRELRNAIERAVVLADGPTIEPKQLPDRLRGEGPAPSGVKEELRQIERQRILQALQACGWNQTKAAQRLGMPRRTLVHKIRQYGLRKP